MIKVMTLNTGAQPGSSTKQLQEWLDPLRHAPLDILCCQSLRRDENGSEDITRTLSQSLGLTSSCIAASRQVPKKQDPGKADRSGLAILTGPEVWMLNSGGLSMPAEEECQEWIAQFALVRKNSTSILVLNVQLAPSAPTQVLQLQSLFSHPLLKEHYGAVVLCGDRPAEISAKELRALTTRSNYALDSSVPPVSKGGGREMLCLLTARDQPETAVTLGKAGGSRWAVAPGKTPGSQPGMRIEFEVNRIPQAKKSRRYLPLSFREQWLGNKEKYPAFAA